MLISEVTKETSSSDLQPLARGELHAILADINASAPLKVSPITKLHLDDLKVRITQALQPKSFLHPGATPSAGRIIFGGDAREDDGGL